MLIKNNEVREKQVANDSYVFESVPMDNKISVDLVKINGRYPDKGFGLNKECELVYFITEGLERFL